MINRRDSLGLLAGMAVVSTSAADAGPGRGSADDSWTRSEDGLLHALMKLRAALDDRVTLEWFKGVVYGVVDSAMTPMFTVNAVAFAFYREADDGSFRGKRIEVTYHGDLASNARLDTCANPYNGEIMEVPVSRTPLQDAVIDRNGLVAPSRMGEMRIESQPGLGPGQVNGERCWVRLDTRTRLFVDGVPAPVLTYGESISYCGLNRDVLDDAIVAAPCEISYTNIMSWRPWMKMQGIAGHSTTVASGQKVESLADVPPDLASFVREQHPDLAGDPYAALTSRAGPEM